MSSLQHVQQEAKIKKPLQTNNNLKAVNFNSKKGGLLFTGHEEEKPGFPMSLFLREQEVGLGRAARNFASQTINRPTSEVNTSSL